MGDDGLHVSYSISSVRICITHPQDRVALQGADQARAVGGADAVEEVPRLHARAVAEQASGSRSLRWLRTNGVNTNGAAAKVINFGRFGEKVRPGTFGNIKVG